MPLSVLLLRVILQMVAGRFINAYSGNDWMLGVAFRARYLKNEKVVNCDRISADLKLFPVNTHYITF